MATITLEEAQAQLVEIVNRLAPGEEIVLTRDDRPVATLQAAADTRGVPQLGTLKGAILYIAPDFDAIPEGFEEYLM